MNIHAETDMINIAQLNLNVKAKNDYNVGLSCTHVSCTETFAYGLMIGEGEHQLNFYIAASGSYQIFEGEKIITGWNKSATIKTKNNQVNRLEIFNSGSSCKFYINGELVYEYTFMVAPFYNKMLISLMVSQKQKNEFDDVLVKGTYEQPMFVK